MRPRSATVLESFASLLKSLAEVGVKVEECVTTVALLASGRDGRLWDAIVVDDEVEAMTVARSAASLSANPADVHRATDAVLTALDSNAATHPHLVVTATSNFTDTLDEAFLSRCDAAVLIPLPSPAAIAQILAATLRDFAALDLALGRLAESPMLARVAARLDGIDGRQARKLVTEAMARRLDTVLDPGALTPADLLAAAEDWAAGRIHRPSRGDRDAAA